MKMTAGMLRSMIYEELARARKIMRESDEERYGNPNNKFGPLYPIAPKDDRDFPDMPDFEFDALPGSEDYPDMPDFEFDALPGHDDTRSYDQRVSDTINRVWPKKEDDELDFHMMGPGTGAPRDPFHLIGQPRNPSGYVPRDIGSHGRKKR